MILSTMIGARLEQLSISRRRESCSEAWCCSRTPGGRHHHRHVRHHHRRHRHRHLSHYHHYQQHHCRNHQLSSFKSYQNEHCHGLNHCIMSITNATTKNPKCTSKRYDAANILNLPNNHLVYDHVTMRIPVSHDHFEQMESALQKSFVLRANELVDGNLSKRRRNWWLTDSQLSKGRMGLVPLFEVLRVNFAERSIPPSQSLLSCWRVFSPSPSQTAQLPLYPSSSPSSSHKNLRLKLAWSLTGRVPLQYWGDNCRGSFLSPSTFNIPLSSCLCFSFFYFVP